MPASVKILTETVNHDLWFEVVDLLASIKHFCLPLLNFL
jgi:hypothetical protein